MWKKNGCFEFERVIAKTKDLCFALFRIVDTGWLVKGERLVNLEIRKNRNMLYNALHSMFLFIPALPVPISNKLTE